jgi:hypothetical protein
MIADRDNLESAARNRRGNTMVLVVGILVLLAIIATSYLTRTHAGRVTAISQQRASLRDDNARVIAESLANEISQALFVRPIDPSTVAPGNVADSRSRRLGLGPLDRDQNGVIDYLPLRYGYDPTDVMNNLTGLAPGDGIPDFPYNFAPHYVVPFTNWPDPVALSDRWPKNPGGMGGLDLLMLFGVGEGNPIGDPGFGDTRWLADLEPLRWDTDGDGFADDAFAHWRHLTNIARPDNGWRICRDISDLTDIDGDGVGGLVLDLRIPVEQWLAVGPFKLDFGTGDSVYDANYFWDQWLNWFDFDQYQFSYTVSEALPRAIPPNFYNLDNLDGGIDLDGDGDFVDWYERPEAEFIHDPDSARWHVGRVLADADGDGFTDSYWFLAPTTVERGIRQVVAVRIVDNSGMINTSVATAFEPADPANPALLATRTEGITPADIALVGQLLPYPALSPLPGPEDHWNVGFYDNPHHWYDLTDGLLPNEDRVRYDDDLVGGVDPVNLWIRHLQEVGLYDFVLSQNAADPDYLKIPQESRLDYWRLAGLSPVLPDPGAPFTPYGLPEEIELRMFHGNNYPWIYSRQLRLPAGFARSRRIDGVPVAAS